MPLIAQIAGLNWKIEVVTSRDWKMYQISKLDLFQTTELRGLLIYRQSLLGMILRELDQTIPKHFPDPTNMELNFLVNLLPSWKRFLKAVQCLGRHLPPPFCL